MTSTLEKLCAELIESLGLGKASEVTSVRPLSGGVASDIAAVTFGGRTVCAKFALPKLKVAEDWFAPVHRGRAEYAWLKAASAVVPESVPALLGWSDRGNGFAMEFIDGPGIYLWKDALLQGAAPRGEAAAVAEVLGRLHAASTSEDFDRSPFDNAADFDQLRLDPYLRFTAARHPDLAGAMVAMAEALLGSRVALVHGDVSPKNIMIRDGRPIILDAECATIGDPAFDVAFCLNHVVLKSFHMPERQDLLRAEARAFWSAYAAHVGWEPAGQLEARVAALLPMLMLARIDGKSPVEYLDEAARARVRAAAMPLIASPASGLADVLNRLQ
ncbi:phosphotransferase family protein [Frigidibacter sp. ROC022]|uniref:phosphotransferase family protein n=1 Tax=Frigidibacter sp. ROC022 TaxID=2971796 RepID=UPI00215A9576|nr:aminoglycoside phosphotransferase family protein [Frigidibacter sp. ROC022]MCR8723541.1 aminoglycoside phosphotransferase family protein [Frigidibacter sp. ROC022]